jgi:hypothetical protein
MAVTKKTPKQTCLLEIVKGDRVVESSGRRRRGRVVDFRLTPNGINDPKLVCLLVVDIEGGGRVVSTADKWLPVEDDYYIECYPSLLLDIGSEGLVAQKADGKKPDMYEIDGPISLLEV